MICTIGSRLCNIRNSCNVGIKSALHGMSQEKIDLGVFQETKVMGGFAKYIQEGNGLQKRRHQGRIKAASLYCNARWINSLLRRSASSTT